MAQKILSRYDPGMDYGAERRLLIGYLAPVMTHEKRYDHKRPALWINGSYRMAMGARGFGQTYVPTSLTLRYVSERCGLMTKSLATGRISLETLFENAEAIDAAFGQPVTSLLNTRETQWLDVSGTVMLGFG